jgi:hypothetical protein
MTKPSIRLLITLALTTAAVTAGWTHADSAQRATTGIASQVISVGIPDLTPHTGEPDPTTGPIPRFASREDRFSSRPTVTWFSWASRVWAMWYLRSAW